MHTDDTVGTDVHGISACGAGMADAGDPCGMAPQAAVLIRIYP